MRPAAVAKAARPRRRVSLPKLPESVTKLMPTRSREAAEGSAVSAHTYAFKPNTGAHPVTRAFSASQFRDIIVGDLYSAAVRKAGQSTQNLAREGTPT